MFKSGFTLLLFFIFSLANAQNGILILDVEGVRADKGGEVYAALFTEGNFPVTGRHVIGAETIADAPKVQVVVAGVPTGWYGIAVFQDVDSNKQLTTNFIGLPKEPFGFSNNAPLRFGPPAFKDARVWVDAGTETVLSIYLR